MSKGVRKNKIIFKKDEIIKLYTKVYEKIKFERLIY
jgi:hypothetical protein